MSIPRPSNDEESAPLLENHEHRDQAIFSALFRPSRPLTNLEKFLGGAGVIVLLLMSTFIGLFAGAQNKLGQERGNHEAGRVTETLTATATATATTTSVATTTISTSPTGSPKAVSLACIPAQLAPQADLVPSPSKDVCLSKDCVLLSASILDALNTTVDPCEDFYEFANGGWISKHSIPADRGIYTTSNEISDRNKKIILKVLDSIPSKMTDAGHSAEEANLHKLKSVFTSCMGIDTLNRLGLDPLLPMTDYLLESFGPFDLIPAPELELADESEEWRDTWDDSYTVTADLLAAAARAEGLKAAKKIRRGSWLRPDDTDVLSAQALDDAEETNMDKEKREKMTKTLAYLHSRGVSALVNFAIEGDAGGEDSQVQSLWLYQEFGGLPAKEYYEEVPILDLYQSVVQGILVDIASHTKASVNPAKRDILDDLEEIEGWPWPWPGDDDHGGEGKKPKPGNGQTKDEPLKKRMEKLAGKVVRFERELVRAGADLEALFNPKFAYNSYSTESVGKALPFLSIPEYLSAFTPRSFPENVSVTYPPYLKSLTKLVKSTPDYVLSGYFVTRLAMTYAIALGPKVGVRQETRRLEEVLRGLKKGTEENRQDVCLNTVDDIIGFIAGREYVREAFSPEARADGESIIRGIVKAFHEKLPHISWMDEISAKAAQKKAEAIIPKIGYPLSPDTTDPESLAKWYARVEIKADDFFGNVLRSTLEDTYKLWATLGTQRDRQTWDMDPQTVNAYYSPPDGEIVFPAGILQVPMYSPSWPAHLKYGAFGSIAAHELTHAFDNSGSQYDEKGRLRDWWTNSTVKAFEERAQCIARQYSKYYVYDGDGNKVYVNGNLTNGENIGDSGLAQAYVAWKQLLADSAQPAELRLPGLAFTDDQLFFIAFARVWANLVRPATAVSHVRNDPHSPNYWRTTGTLRNLEPFHRAFGCKVGSGMNPPKADQCELW